jgi:hypothetical protein
MPGPQVGEPAPDFTLPRSLDAVLRLQAFAQASRYTTQHAVMGL